MRFLNHRGRFPRNLELHRSIPRIFGGITTEYYNNEWITSVGDENWQFHRECHWCFFTAMLYYFVTSRFLINYYNDVAAAHYGDGG